MINSCIHMKVADHEQLADLLKIEIVLVEVALSVTEDFLGILKLLEILFYTPLIVVEDTNITETSFDLP